MYLFSCEKNISWIQICKNSPIARTVFYESKISSYYEEGWSADQWSHPELTHTPANVIGAR